MYIIHRHDDNDDDAGDLRHDSMHTRTLYKTSVPFACIRFKKPGMPHWFSGN